MIRPSVTMPASLAAIVALVGLALMYWSLVELGLLRRVTEDGAESVPSSASSPGKAIGVIT